MRKKNVVLVNLAMITLLVLTLAGCASSVQDASRTPVTDIPSGITEAVADIESQKAETPLKLSVMDYEAVIERKDDKSVLIHYPSVVYPQDIMSFGKYLYEKYPQYFDGSTFVLLGDNTAYLEMGYAFTDDEVREYLPAIASEIEAFVPVYFASLQEAGAPVRLSEKAIAEAAAQKAEAEKAENTADIPSVVSTPVVETLPASTVSEPAQPAESVIVPQSEVQVAPVSEKAVEIAEATAAEKAGRSSSGSIILVAVIIILAASCICYYLYTKKKKN